MFWHMSEPLELPLLLLPTFQQAEKVSDVAEGQQELFG
jgi:hypothetical protein